MPYVALEFPRSIIDRLYTNCFITSHETNKLFTGNKIYDPSDEQYVGGHETPHILVICQIVKSLFSHPCVSDSL